MKVWITRDNTDTVLDNVKAWLRKPSKRKDNSFYDPYFTISAGWFIMDKNYFKKSFGFTPRKGSCVERELIFKPVFKKAL